MSEELAQGQRLGRDAIAALIPHRGSMCLLERVIEWDAEHIVIATHTHRSPDNPLLSVGRLRGVLTQMQGAQAMAVHGGLLARAADARAAPGMLVALREVELLRAYAEDLAGSLRVAAQRLIGGQEGSQYRFTVHHGAELLARGRAAIVVPKERVL